MNMSLEQEPEERQQQLEQEQEQRQPPLAKEKDLLDRFVTFVAATYHNDKGVKLLGYSLSVMSQIIRYRNGGQDTPHSEGFNDLYRALASARVLFRMQGTAEAVWEMKNVSGANGWEDPKIRPLTRLQAFTNLFYYPMEEVAMAGGIAPKLIRIDQAWWWAKSDWAWLAYCIIDMYMNVLKGRELRKREQGVRRKLRDCAEYETSRLLDELAELAVKKRRIALQQWRMVFYLPNAVHWAFYKPPMPSCIVAMLGFAEAAVGAVQAFPPPG